MRNIIFVAPFPLASTLEFTGALARLRDVRLLGIFMQRPKGPGADAFDDIQRVTSVFDAAQLSEAVALLADRYGAPHRILGVLEELQIPLAQLRVRHDVPGIDLKTARLFRDKAAMKDALRAAGLPCARHLRVASTADAWAFIEQVGFPIVLKPPAGAGCRATYRVSTIEELHNALMESRPSRERPVLAEEFLTGAEFSFETLTLNGQVRFHSIGRYYPGPLEVMEKPWIQWVVHLPRDISGPEFGPVREIGARALSALGLRTGITHMEWFRRPDGRIAIGEIAARPPGARIMSLMGHAHGVDMFHVWARLMVDDEIAEPLTRQFSAGAAFLRGVGMGRVVGVEGLDAAQRRVGDLVVAASLPAVGAPRRPGYEGEGHAIVRHTDSARVKAALLDLITTVKVRYG